MDKHILEQYNDMRTERNDLMRRVQSLDARLLNLEMNVMVTDTVSRGKKGHQSLGTVRIEGFPSRDYERYKQQLRRYKQLLIQKDDELLEKQIEVEEYIDSISDSYIRSLMRYRYMDGLTWRQVARQMHTTEEAARKTISRYLENETN